MDKQIIPENFEDFLYWVKETTERRWANLFKSKKDGNWWNHKHDLFQGAKWVDPLTDEEVDALEIKWKIKFPADFRSFLKILHRVDKCDYFQDEDFETGEIELIENELFHNWRDELLIKDRFDFPFECMRLDIFESQMPSWLKSWGEKPDSELECLTILNEWKEKAIRILIPVNSHRYLVVTPNNESSHVISSYGFDTILYSLNLREHLINELRWDLGLDEREYDDDYEDEKPAPFAIAKAINAIKNANEDSEEAIEEDIEEDTLKLEAEMDAWLEERRKAYIPIPYWEEVILYYSSGWSGIGLKFPYENNNSKVQPILKAEEPSSQKLFESR